MKIERLHAPSAGECVVAQRNHWSSLHIPRSTMFLREYVRMLSIVFGAMAIYYLTINQWIQWRADEPKKVSAPSPVEVDVSQRWWSTLFAPEAWQNNQPQRLVLKRAEVLFQSIENQGPRRYKLKPLTILLPQSSEANGKPNSVLKIECPAGAEVQSESDMNDALMLSSGSQSTSLSSVHFEGDVTISSIPLNKSADQSMQFEAKTSFLNIDGNRIWSMKEISMRMGNSIFEGSDFEFISSSDILARKDANTNTKEGPFAGLDHLEIIYVNRIEIELANGGLLKNQVADQYVGREIPPSQMLVQCKKAFHFDFQRMLATLNDRVVIRHVYSGFPVDQIEADKVDLQFTYQSNAAQGNDPPDNNQIDRKKPGQFEMSGGALTLQGIEGFGKSTDNVNDERRWIAIHAPNFMTECTTRWIKVNVNENAVELANQLPSEKSIESSPVYLHRDDLKVWTPKLIYRMDSSSEETQVPQPQHLGALWAQGPGEATMRTTEGETWTANWSNTLILRRDKDEDLVTLDGAAQVRSDRQGRFSAENLEVWLKDFMRNNAPDANKQSPQFLPTRLHAIKNVIVASTTLRAQVEELKLWFDHVLRPSAPENAVATISQPGASNVAAAQVPAAQVPEAQAASVQTVPSVNTVSQPHSGLQPLGNVRATPERRPLFSDATTVTGVSLEAKLLLPLEGDAIVEHLMLQGGVTMTKERVSESFALPATVTGDQVVVERGESDDLIFHIFGQPAKVLVGGGNVIGNSIHYDQQRQFLYMPEAGELTIPPEMLAPETQKPVSAMPLANNSPLSAPPLMNQMDRSNTHKDNAVAWRENPRLTWNGHMEFDGHLARFSKDIAIRGVYQSDPATLWHLEAMGDDLYVEVLGNAFDQKNKTESTKVQSVQLQGKVDVKAAQTDMAMVRKSLEHLRVPVLTIFPITQTLRGGGPGELLSRRYSGKASAAQPQSGIAANQPQNDAAAPQPLASTQESLDCLHLTFTDELDGSYGESRVTFRNSVAAIMGPIRDWPDALDVNRINVLAPGQSRLETQELSIYSTKDLPHVKKMEKDFPGSTKAAWEIIARGKLIVESNTEQGVLDVTAEAGRYDALNEILAVEGAPQHPAHVKKQGSAARPENIDSDMVRGLFNLRTGAMQVSATSIGGKLPNMGAPKSGGQTPAGRPVNTPPAPADQPSIPSPRDFNVMPRNQQSGY